ncbi:UDP-N-acetylglucosamine--N-acetylmuramyl-(pentapeptide) pyrophosphoryl-undecaprenol N-acetylglucosamine transferase [Bacilli bacterium PM5-3]|nr:UDP-N-acetylglucosamine--N-acetylmuramyl-(pentapeptide) pyrophosphoryl-undecaprenol N-acetylglucosamine transferase [Bacilli bacterium PM5-3]MDH6603232.1 UDP-N-acetylglucosamine--N-acetylmuramyl-(pentapeptide) pyrophosphoryl-undecaprenol N-acetylglucosamine transferase [Bacilli bacterium PM5-9]
MRIIFSAGGTGGHLYPAIALADYISKHNDSTILFVGSKYRIEATKVAEHGYDFIGLDLKTPSGSVLKKAKGYFDVFKNIKKSEKIIEDFKPDVVIGFGGYTSYSILKAAQNKKIITLLHEQNSIIGKSNKVLASKVDALITSYDLQDQVSKDNVYCLGNPTSYHVMQSDIANLNDYDLSNDMPTVLIVMGSQGSQTIDNIMFDILNEKEIENYQLIYICGNDYYERYQDLDFEKNVKIISYENKLTSLIKACDLIVSRAGASALTEIISANKPSILIPSIHVTNNHQYHNAISLVDAKCAIMCEENEMLKTNLVKEIDSLIVDENKLFEMEKNTKVFNYNDSAMNIFNLIKKKVGEKNGK